MSDNPTSSFHKPREPLSDVPSDEEFLSRISELSIDLGTLGYPKLSGACSAAFVALLTEIALTEKIQGAFQQCQQPG